MKISKRIIPIVLVLCFLIGCGQKGRIMSDHYRRYCEKVLEIADKYLDFEISANEAYDRINSLDSSIKSYPESEDEEEERGNRSARLLVMTIEWDFVTNNGGEILEDRNAIARLIGKRER